MINGREESHIMDPEMPSLEDGALTAEPPEGPSLTPSHNMQEVRRRQRTNRDGSRSPPHNYTNVFISRVNIVPQERGISLNDLTPRGLGEGRLLNMMVNNLKDSDVPRS